MKSVFKSVAPAAMVLGMALSGAVWADTAKEAGTAADAAVTQPVKAAETKMQHHKKHAEEHGTKKVDNAATANAKSDGKAAAIPATSEKAAPAVPTVKPAVPATPDKALPAVPATKPVDPAKAK